MSKLTRIALAAGLAALAMPAMAHDAAPTPAGPARAFDVPAQLNGSEREAWQAVFADLRASNWSSASARLAAMREGPLNDVATAMLYTAPGSPRVELEPLMRLLERAPDLPQAADLARLAATRGATSFPEIPQAQRLAGLAGQPRRQRPRAIRGDAVADALEPRINPLLVEDQPFAAESVFNERSAELSPEARTAFQQRIAWVFYLNGYDRDARRLADMARTGPTEWATHADWVAGLASWRMRDCAAAAAYFGNVAARSGDIELSSAGHYWAARADTACGHPERVQARLQAAARQGETFYGLLAQSALGVRHAPAALDALSAEEWRSISNERNIRAAVALAELGETELADGLIRHQARIGGSSRHEALLHLAARLNLTSCQMWLAHNGPRGTRTATHDRYPSPSWRPQQGWRVDPALAFAHALQESNFRPEAVSSAGARGLMQVRPGTGAHMARLNGGSVTATQLNVPSINMEYGQTYLEYLRDRPETGGLLPRVIASYNAGPQPVGLWNSRFDQSDPLLAIETIPYWETRGYVPIVLRNYWIYEEQSADRSTSRRAFVQGLWPRFPGMRGATAVRIAPRPQTRTAMTSPSPQAGGGATTQVEPE
ncbi:lytic transglycosylase domain-containing protein [Sphingosinicella sp. LHD-64]|uniref:lytic transglycosylase domain-containing protein n=1 Tax=Sphingosinicella sp. LHD-64 TaxID=3072139 RepID=UPI00280E0D5F|nr:lytic transglycosylase domain-containing protein [Sphingosinicella sp. LHD-64]MDQ8755249.1 lytic transglycosylase domain-containing protein [Sphingosinicella sp. LHD-64]